MTTYGLKVGAGPDYPIAYVSDSAPTASGWSTGKKTVDGRALPRPQHARPTCPVRTTRPSWRSTRSRASSSATSPPPRSPTPPRPPPASHINARACQGPTDMAELRRRPARPTAARAPSPSSSSTTRSTSSWVAAPTRYAQPTDAGPTRAVLRPGHPQATASSRTPPASTTSPRLAGGPVLGLFAAGNMTPMYKPLVATRRRRRRRRRPSASPTRPRQPARPVRDDAEVDRAARQPQRVLPSGRERDDRQAGARLRHLRRHR